MQDHPDIQRGFLYKLASNGSLDAFQHIVLFSSPQDSYSPYDSSRIQVSQKVHSSKLLADSHADMVLNILKNLHCEEILRVDLCLKFKNTSLDTLTGRAAHISLINDGLLLEMVAYRYSYLL
jgi:hypothetical protein